jgi:hypothetical protein
MEGADMRTTHKTLVRTLAVAAVIAASFGVSARSADAAVSFRGCQDAQLPARYSDVSSYQVCSWAVDYGANGVSYYAYIDRWQTYSSYANGQQFGWHTTVERTFVYQLVNGDWMKHSCVWRWPTGEAQYC